LFINASENGDINTLRNDIRSFASSLSFNNKIRCVILDEADQLTWATQPALRAFIEEFSSNCRFILTSNSSNKIIDPIKSRCNVLDFSLNKVEKSNCVLEFNNRLKTILETENVEFSKKDLAEIVIKYFPDNRKILNELQRFSVSGSLSLSQMSSFSDELLKQIFRAMKEKKFLEIRKWCAQNIDIEFSSLIRSLYDNVIDYVEVASIPDFIMILSEYDYQHSFVTNPEIHTVSMFIEIMKRIDIK
jgi:DNA polymerase III delta prime subunit